MNFVSWAFAALFLVVFVARLTVGRRKVESPYVAVLLLSSLVFYGWHVPVYLLVLLGAALVDYVAALAMGGLAPGQHGRRRALLVASLVANLGLLGILQVRHLRSARPRRSGGPGGRHICACRS